MKAKQILALAISCFCGASAAFIAVAYIGESGLVWPYSIAGGVLGVVSVGANIGEAIMFTLVAGVAAVLFCLVGVPLLFKCIVLCIASSCSAGQIAYGIYREIQPS